MGLIAWIRRQREWRRSHIAAFSTATQKQPDGLTIFQHQALAAVAPHVATSRFKRVAMSDRSGEYLVAPLGHRGSDLYIYPNEAGIFGAKPHSSFEEWDYLTPRELLDALAEECAARAV